MIIKENVMITPFNLERTLHIYLPDNYDPNKKYPVFYMYDGHNLYLDSDATYGHAWHISDQFTQNNVEMIVVGLECNHEGRERLNEFSPYDIKGGFLNGVKGRGKELMAWMSKDLVEYIDSKYSTNGINYIGGSSMGGLMSIYSVVKYPHVYKGAACLSSAIGGCYEALIEDINLTESMKDNRVYMSLGSNEPRDKDSLAKAVKLHMVIEELMVEKGASVFFDMIVDGNHNEATWETQVMDFVRYMTK